MCICLCEQTLQGITAYASCCATDAVNTKGGLHCRCGSASVARDGAQAVRLRPYGTGTRVVACARFTIRQRTDRANPCGCVCGRGRELNARHGALLAGAGLSAWPGLHHWRGLARFSPKAPLAWAGCTSCPPATSVRQCPPRCTGCSPAGRWLRARRTA